MQVLGKSGTLTYLSAVDSAVSVFMNLSSYQVTGRNDIAGIAPGQLAIIKVTSLDNIPKLYRIAQGSSKKLVVAITGKTCSYFNSRRAKRATEDDQNLIVKTTNVLLHTATYPTLAVCFFKILFVPQACIIRFLFSDQQHRIQANWSNDYSKFDSHRRQN